MSCSNPWQRVNNEGKIQQIPCGLCMACRIDKQNEWADRLAFELIGKEGSFVTLTYDDEHFPLYGSLSVDHLQKFIKRLRYWTIGRSIKYYAVGEYGEESSRPHYHLIITNFDALNDEKYIDRCWKYGFYTIAPFTTARIRYILKYMDKQQTKKQWYEENGENYQRPFALMSRGIGLDFLIANQDSIAEQNGYWIDGKLRPAPRYYRQKIGVLTDGQIGNVDKLRRVKEYMELTGCTYNQALCRLGENNEKDMLAKKIVYQNGVKKI